MPRISGMLKVGEASLAAGALLKRQQGSSASYVWIQLAFMLGGLAAGLLASLFVVGGISRNGGLGAFVGLLAGTLAYWRVRRRLVTARFKQEFQDRQQTLDLPIRVEISEACLTYEVGGVTQLARWPVVDELFRSHGYWIFHAQAHAMFAPQRLFLNEDEERQFIRLALSHMSSEARDRSADAVRFVDSKGVGA